MKLNRIVRRLYLNKSEKELLSGFIDLWIELDPTIISGWNSAFFDMPYLYNRIRLVCGEEVALYLSPIRKVNYNEYKKRIQ
jgi:DNA polymerase elongation subunit (family B)